MTAFAGCGCTRKSAVRPGQRGRQVLGKAIWSGNARSRPQAVRRHIRLLARKSPLTLTVEPPCCGPENLGRNRTCAPAPLGR